MLKFNRAPDRVDLVLRHTDPDRIDDLGATTYEEIGRVHV